MPRTRRGSELGERLDRAMKVFWEKGYYDTSIEDLGARSGLHRAAIYGGFGSKKKLFETLLDRYRATYIAKFFAPLEVPGAGLSQLEAFFRQFQKLQEPEVRLGCLMCLTSSEVAPHVRSVERIVSRFLDDLRSRIHAACMTARDRGEVRAAADPDLVADYGVGAVLGLWAMIRSPIPRSAIDQYVNGVLIFLQGLRPANDGGGEQ